MPLFEAVILNNTKEVGKLLRQVTVDVTKPNNRGETPLHVTCSKSVADSSKVEIIRLLLENGAKIDARIKNDPKEFTPLFKAILSGNIVMTRYLIKNGADINATSKLGTPLHVAVAEGDPVIVGILLKGGAEVNVKDEKGKTPLAILLQLLRLPKSALPVWKSQDIQECLTLLRKYGAKE